MQFIHSREHLNSGDVVIVNSDTQCNVMLTDDSNFRSFKARQRFSHYGGFYKSFPIRIAAPHSGYWNITLDVGEGYQANIRSSVTVQRG